MTGKRAIGFTFRVSGGQCRDDFRSNTSFRSSRNWILKLLWKDDEEDFSMEYLKSAIRYVNY